MNALRWVGGWAVILGLGGCAGPVGQPVRDAAVPRFYLEAAVGAPAAELLLPQSGLTIAVNPRPVLTEYDVVRVQLAEVALGRGWLFHLTPSAGRALHRLSAQHPGRRLVLLVNDRPVGVRVFDGPLAGGALLMLVEVPDTELPALADRLDRTAQALQSRLADR